MSSVRLMRRKAFLDSSLDETGTSVRVVCDWQKLRAALPLTDDEAKVVAAVAVGNHAKVVAIENGMNIGTAQHFMTRIPRRLGFQSQTVFLAWLHHKGLASIEGEHAMVCRGLPPEERQGRKRNGVRAGD